MHSLRAAIFSLIGLGTLPLTATPELALKIQQTWEKNVTEWKQDAEKAVTAEQRTELEKNRPNPTAYAQRMWGGIKGSLQEPWTLEPAAWFLQITHGLNDPETNTPIFANEIESIKKAILANHVATPDPRLHTMCMALTRLGDPFSLSILETIESKNTDAKIQGVAALAAAMVVKGLGDDGELMRKRLTYLRKAIINSAEVEIAGTTVAELAENELYMIRFLSKGRQAPEITGMDSTNGAFQLTRERGKVVILIFWSTTIAQAEHTIEFTNELAAKFKDKPVTIIGINHDPLEKLRAMRADDIVKWRNLSDPENEIARDYRVGSWPIVYVLDQEGKIQYSGALGSFAELTAEALMAKQR